MGLGGGEIGKDYSFATGYFSQIECSEIISIVLSLSIFVSNKIEIYIEYSDFLMKNNNQTT